MTSLRSGRAPEPDYLGLMISRLFLLALIILLIPTCAEPDSPASESTLEEDVWTPAKLDPRQTIHRIAFGSCNRTDRPQPMWEEIMAVEPDLWIWLGDNVYGDTENMLALQAEYQKQLNIPEYRSLVQMVPVIGTWDDHDYGVNDGGNTYPKRAESADLMLDFFAISADAPVRSYEGIYQSFVAGGSGQRIKIILLDARYFRDPIHKVGGVYQPNTDGTILGEAQWAWLEEELGEADIELFLIAGGIQFISEEHRFEKWANFPQERQRLLDLIVTSQPARVVLLSGDRHIGEISCAPVDGLSYQLCDITSSGLTHAWTGNTDEVNQWRVSPIVNQKNFGLLEIDWSASHPDVLVKVKGLDDQTFVEYQLSF